LTTENGSFIEGGGQGGGKRVMNIPSNMEVIGIHGTPFPGCLKSVGFWLKPISRWKERRGWVVYRVLFKDEPERIALNKNAGNDE